MLSPKLTYKTVMTKATNNVARVAAAVAGLGLVAMSLAPAVGAQTTTTTTTTTTSATFTRDLTVGSTGADVTALQTWLIAKGYSIPAGATGYFGAQTKAALAAYQAANAITPAAGYFGPITRAAVAAAGGSTTGGTTGGSTSGSLSGGEADITGFNLLSGDTVSEGDSNTEIAVAQFDVKGGDAEVQRVTVELTPTSTGGASNLPWKYFDSLSVYNGSKKVGDVDAGSKSDWDKSDNTYSIDIPVDTIIKEDTTNAELSIRATAQDTIDSTDASNGGFTLVVPTNGIRAVDSEGIQQYTGKDSDSTSVDFDSAQSGDLTVTTSSDTPGAGVLVADDQDTSDDLDVLAFSIRNKDDADVDFDTLVFNVATSTASGSSAKNISSMIRRATLDLDGDTYTGTVSNVTSGQQTITFDDLNTSVSGNDTIDGTLSVELYGQTGHFAASGESLTFSLVGNTTNVVAESSDNGDTSDVSGTASGKKQTIGVNTGITVAGNSNSTSEAYNSTTPSLSTGNFTLKFDVTANGDNDVYIPKSVVATASTTAESSNPNAGAIVFTDIANTAFAGSASTSASISSTADTDPDNTSYYVIHTGDTETFTINVTTDAYPNSGYYQVGLDMVRFTTVSTGGSLQSLDVDQTDSDFQTGQLYIH
jgi:peptidoglycan hydrolase-like protein with peptidoglycan-binding domain